MIKQVFNRKLAAILHADVKGYSRMMGEDEEATVSTLTACMEVMSELIIKHRGRIVGSAGDSLLAEFISVVDAVRCAVEIQDDLKAENNELSEERKVMFRIGINLGDVIEKDGDLLGDGVNIAARVEALASGGGICITRSVYDLVKKKLNLGYEYIGEHTVKNIADPVRVYRVLTDPEAVTRKPGEPKRQKNPSKKLLIPIFTILVLVVIVAVWQYYPTSPEIEPASVAKMALPLPVEPSIAVLSFDNMSGDPEQEYFSDGITEQIITSLSNVPYIFVISRNSTFAYKNKAINVVRIAEELGVQYVMEGSVQRSGGQVRITAQLIDALTGRHLWAENYDRHLSDIFALQDEIAMKIMAALQVELTLEELGNLSATKTDIIKAYEKFLLGSEHIMRRTGGDSEQARKLAQEAIALDPDYSGAYQLLARTYLDDVWYYKTKSVAKTLDKVEQLTRQSIELTGEDAITHYLLSQVYFLRRHYDKALVEGRKAIDLSPSSANANFSYGRTLRFAGRFDEAIFFFNKAIRLNPITPLNYQNNLAWAYLFAEQYEKAIIIWNKTLKRNPDYLFPYMGLALVYQLSGNEFEAREAVSEVMRLKPDLTITKIKKGPATKNIDRERMLEAYRKAGIPE